MHRVASLLAALLLLAVLVLPASGAQIPNSTPVAKCSRECYPLDGDVNGPDPKRGAAPVKVILYGHFEDILNRAPLNTQLPNANPGVEPDLNRGFLMPVLSTKTGTEADFHFENNNFVMFSSAGLVEIVDGVWRSHQEPGLAEDVEVKSSKINLYWYMSAHAIPNGDSQHYPGNQANLGVVPQIAVKAKMETGRIPDSPKATVIALGDTGTGDTANLLGGDGRINMFNQPGVTDPVFEFMVPMEVQPNGHTIPSVASAAGFIVSIHPYQIRAKDSGGHEVMQADWRVRTGITFPPRLVFDIGNPMVTKASSLSLFDNNMFIRWSFVSPWGSYDTEDKSLSIKVTGPTQVDPKLINLVILKRSVDHDGHFKPINATWKFDYRKAGLSDGDYTFKLSIHNLQHTYVLEQELPFKVVNGQPDVKVVGGGKRGGGAGHAQSAKDDSKGLPGFEPLLLVSALVGVAVAFRRRKD